MRAQPQEYRAGAGVPELEEDCTGPAPEHILYGLPAPVFDWAAYFDRQFEAKAPNQLRSDDPTTNQKKGAGAAKV